MSPGSHSCFVRRRTETQRSGDQRRSEADRDDRMLTTRHVSRGFVTRIFVLADAFRSCAFSCSACRQFHCRWRDRGVDLIRRNALASGLLVKSTAPQKQPAANALRLMKRLNQQYASSELKRRVMIFAPLISWSRNYRNIETDQPVELISRNALASGFRSRNPGKTTGG